MLLGAKSDENYIFEKLEKRRFDLFASHSLLEILHNIFSGLLDKDIVLTLPSIVDIIISVKCRHFAVS